MSHDQRSKVKDAKKKAGGRAATDGDSQS